MQYLFYSVIQTSESKTTLLMKKNIRKKQLKYYVFKKEKKKHSCNCPENLHAARQVLCNHCIKGISYQGVALHIYQTNKIDCFNNKTYHGYICALEQKLLPAQTEHAPCLLRFPSKTLL